MNLCTFSLFKSHIFNALVYRKRGHGNIITPTCPRTGVAIETGCHDEAEEKTPPPVHPAVTLRFQTSCKNKAEVCFPSGGPSVGEVFFLQLIAHIYTHETRTQPPLQNFPRTSLLWCGGLQTIRSSRVIRHVGGLIGTRVTLVGFTFCSGQNSPEGRRHIWVS